MLRLANAPTSWGVEDPADPSNPSWSRVMSDIAEAGYAGTELGPLGFYPDDPAVLRHELAERELELVGGYVFEPLHTRSGAERAIETARRTCALLEAAGGLLLVIIPGFTPERERAAGRPGAAQRLPEDAWRSMIEAIGDIARVASEEHGLVPVVHPHAGTPVEFGDEIDRLAAETELPLALDTGHAAYAGIDPVGLYRRLAGRVAYFHLKDIAPEKRRRALARGLGFEAAVGEGVFCPLGEGTVDFAGLHDALEEHGFAGWATVEQDRLPTGSSTPAADAAASLAHLREVGLA
jgi:inosose dehydratase